MQPSISLSAEYKRNLRARVASTIAALVAGLVWRRCFALRFFAYSVKSGERDGIRRALGADAPRVFATLLRQLAWPVSVGMLIGTAAGLLASRLLAGAPFHLAVADAISPMAALSVFALAGFAAALLPASRAMREDPVQALRYE